MGAAYGTAKSALGMVAMGVSKPNLIMKAIIPAVMAGIRAIYGLVVAVLIAAKSTLLCIVYVCVSSWECVDVCACDVNDT